MHRVTSLLLPLVCGLATALPAQELAAPAPEFDAAVAAAAAQDPAGATDPAAAKPGTWKSSVNLGGSLAFGNNERRAATLNAEASRKDDIGRTMVRATWNYSEQKRDIDPSPVVADAQWKVDQRRTTGEAKQDVFLTDDERTYAFLAVEAQNDLNQGIDLRFAATLGIGQQVIQEDNFKWSLELGAGYYIEQFRSGAPDNEYAAGRAGSEVDWQINADWQLLHSLRVYFSLEDGEDTYSISDARLRAKLSEGLFGQLQWIFQWDNTPAPGFNSLGQPQERVDHLLLLSVGWSF